jgi:hypothetical protein
MSSVSSGPEFSDEATASPEYERMPMASPNIFKIFSSFQYLQGNNHFRNYYPIYTTTIYGENMEMPEQ